MDFSSRSLLRGGSLVTGDGATLFPVGSLRIRDGLIAEVTAGLATSAEGECLLDTTGSIMLPGFINAHAHGCIHGPSMPSGSLPLAPQEILWQRNRHLLSGTTSLVNVCGLAMIDEIDRGACDHPLDIHVSSAHTTASIAAALKADGFGLTERHTCARIEDLVRAGCRVLGEAGGGQTLGGGAQDYRFIPEAVEKMTGATISPAIARVLKEAILGRKLDGVGTIDDAGLSSLLEEAGLSARIGPASMRMLIEETVMAPVFQSRLGLGEIAQASARHQVPAIFHHAAATAQTLLDLSRSHRGARMIAGHANHPSFTPEEAIQAARSLREEGVIIDVSTLDMIATRWRNNPANLDALVEARLVDTISTDFAGGDWDPIPLALQRMIAKRQMSLVTAISLATGNVAAVFSELFADRGLLAAGRRADVTVVDTHNLAKVRHVFVQGRPVIVHGQSAWIGGSLTDGEGAARRLASIPDTRKF